MAFSYSSICSVMFFLAMLLSSFFLVASSPAIPCSADEDACNFDYIFSFGVGKTSVSSEGLVLPHLDATSSDHIQGAAFSAPQTFIMSQDFYLQHGLPPHQELGSSYLDSQIDHFLDFLAGSSAEELEHTLIIINHPGLMDYKHALQVRSQTIVLDLVRDIVTEIKNSLRRLIGVGASNVAVSGLKTDSLFGLEILAEVHRGLLYQAVVELRMEFPEARISHLDYRTMPKGRDHLFTSLEVPEGCQAFLERKGHLL